MTFSNLSNKEFSSLQSENHKLPNKYNFDAMYFIQDQKNRIVSKKSNAVKNMFTNEEDQKIIEAYEKLKSNPGFCWSDVSKLVGGGRTPRQCRERYRHYLNPEIKNGKWTLEEEMLLNQKYNEFGPCWSKIARYFHGRTDVNIKNHWTIINKKRTMSKMTHSNKFNYAIPSFNIYGENLPKNQILNDFVQTHNTTNEHLCNQNQIQDFIDPNIDNKLNLKSTKFVNDNKIDSHYEQCINIDTEPIECTINAFQFNDYSENDLFFELGDSFDEDHENLEAFSVF